MSRSPISTRAKCFSPSEAALLAVANKLSGAASAEHTKRTYTNNRRTMTITITKKKFYYWTFCLVNHNVCLTPTVLFVLCQTLIAAKNTTDNCVYKMAHVVSRQQWVGLYSNAFVHVVTKLKQVKISVYLNSMPTSNMWSKEIHSTYLEVIQCIYECNKTTSIPFAFQIHRWYPSQDEHIKLFGDGEVVSRS